MSVGKLCMEDGFDLHWHNGQYPYLQYGTRGVRIPCRVMHHVPLVTPAEVLDQKSMDEEMERVAAERANGSDSEAGSEPDLCDSTDSEAEIIDMILEGEASVSQKQKYEALKRKPFLERFKESRKRVQPKVTAKDGYDFADKPKPEKLRPEPKLKAKQVSNEHNMLTHFPKDPKL